MSTQPLTFEERFRMADTDSEAWGIAVSLWTHLAFNDAADLGPKALVRLGTALSDHIVRRMADRSLMAWTVNESCPKAVSRVLTAFEELQAEVQSIDDWDRVYAEGESEEKEHRDEWITLNRKLTSDVFGYQFYYAGVGFAWVNYDDGWRDDVLSFYYAAELIYAKLYAVWGDWTTDNRYCYIRDEPYMLNESMRPDGVADAAWTLANGVGYWLGRERHADLTVAQIVQMAVHLNEVLPQIYSPDLAEKVRRGGTPEDVDEFFRLADEVNRITKSGEPLMSQYAATFGRLSTRILQLNVQIDWSDDVDRSGGATAVDLRNDMVGFVAALNRKAIELNQIYGHLPPTEVVIDVTI